MFAGIAAPDRARRVAEMLVGPEMFSGWGVRTLSSVESRYNPMSYHNGSIWPHDNALIASGLARYGFTDRAARIMSATGRPGDVYVSGGSAAAALASEAASVGAR